MGPLSTKHNIAEAASLQHDTGEGTAGSGDSAVVVVYGVYMPPDTVEENGHVGVYTDKQEALKAAKKHKRARFKSFASLSEAQEFAATGGGESAVAMTAGGGDPPGSVGGEKASLFKGPKSQDLVRLRKAIESGKTELVETIIDENPRYLFSSGDTPAILQEGFRYNALHVAAKFNNAAVASLVMDRVSCPNFVRRLYGETAETAEAVAERCHVLADLYLNTPEKGLGETPLHFAVKYGSVGVVYVLVAYPQCDRHARNKYNFEPVDVVCSRSHTENTALKLEIMRLLKDQFYVPVLRSEDCSVQPTVGEPYKPLSPQPYEMEPCDSPPNSVISSPMKVQALAGPMDHDTALELRRKWKRTPPRQRALTLLDTEKGLERFGRELAREHQVSWQEYWPFLGTFTNLRTDEGLQLLERYLKGRIREVYESEHREADSSDNTAGKKKEKGAEEEVRTPPSQVLSPMSELCVALKGCQLDSGSGVGGGSKAAMLPSSRPPIPHHQHNGYLKGPNVDHITAAAGLQSADSPHLYIEKSCQVFAKRITVGLVASSDSVGPCLASEVALLGGLLGSCAWDVRFNDVNLRLAHSRLATVVAATLLVEHCDELPSVVQAVRHCQMFSANGDSSCSEEDDNNACVEPATPYRSGLKGRTRARRRSKSSFEQVTCIMEKILAALEGYANTHEQVSMAEERALSTEEACIEVWRDCMPCDCALRPVLSRRISDRRQHGLYRHEMLDFAGDEDITTEPGAKLCEESAGEESDTSDTDSGDFFTPPSSPSKQQCLSVVSDDDMESPDEGPEIFIDGDTPSKMDNAVIHALNPQLLSPLKYPNICRWRHLVLLHSPDQRDRWPSPIKNRRKRDIEVRNATPSWHHRLRAVNSQRS